MHGVSNNSGVFVFPALPPGTYDLTAEKQGFRAFKVSAIPLSVGLTATVDVKLEVGQLTEAVQVTAVGRATGGADFRYGTTVSTRAVAELPLIGRDARQLVRIGAGRNPYARPSRVPVDLPWLRGQLADRRRPGAAERHSDGRRRYARLLSGGQSYTYPIESVAEFKIQTATYSAEFGRAGGGVINVASKSGTNEFHGVAYTFLQSQILNANSWSNNRNRVPKGKFQYDLLAGRWAGASSATVRSFT